MHEDRASWVCGVLHLLLLIDAVALWTMGIHMALQGLRSGGVVVDMTTSSPALAQEIYQAAAARAVHAVDAPVSGGGTVS